MKNCLILTKSDLVQLFNPIILQLLKNYQNFALLVMQHSIKLQSESVLGIWKRFTFYFDFKLYWADFKLYWADFRLINLN